MSFNTSCRVDRNQREIVEALRKVGASVTLLHMVGGGCPDLLCGFRGRNYLIEIKSEKGRLNKSQRAWFAAWQGQAAVARSVEEAMEIIYETVDQAVQRGD